MWVIYIITTTAFCVTNTYGLLPFRNTTLSWDERVDDLVNRLTLEEVTNQTLALYKDPTSTAVPRLGIKPYVWITECMHGQLHSNATAFPHSIGIGATFSKAMMFDMAEAISMEVKAHWNSNKKMGKYQPFYGSSCFSPDINIARHPLWGRIQEVYGECPYLTGVMAQGFVTGLQGSDPRYVRVSSGCKAYDLYAGPENIPVPRFTFNAKVSTRDLRMTFLPAYKMCVDAGTYNLMCSYNSINGVPSCANTELLTNITRKEWGFKGYVVSDDGAITNIRTGHHYTKTDTQSAALAIRAGCNLELGGTVYRKQIEAMNEGLLTEDELRENIKPLIYTRMKLGEFDPDTMNPYTKIGIEEIQSLSHRYLALKVAQKSFTLLKNDMDVLPLKGKVSKLAIVGPFGNVTDQLFGDYSSQILPQYTSTVLEGLNKLSAKTTFNSGCGDTKCQIYNDKGRQGVMDAVLGSDFVIVALGTGQKVESEGNDRANLDLPGYQLDLLKDAVYYAKGAKVVVVLFNAGPLDITWAKENPAVHSIIECYFPGQSAGNALYHTLMASSAEAVPAGRLPLTWPAYLAQVPEMTNYTMEGRTYRYYKGEPLYPFGYGLSYTKFQYTGLSATPTNLTKGQSLMVKVAVKNIGMYDADEVIQVYISWPEHPTVPTPKLQLVGFTRMQILKQQEMTVNFEIKPEQIQVWMDDETGWGIIPGKMLVYAGGQQPNQRTVATSNVLMQTFNIA